jgi:hypothetical protein
MSGRGLVRATLVTDKMHVCMCVCVCVCVCIQVVISVATLATDKMPLLMYLRLLRPFRAIRIIKQIEVCLT